MTHEHHTEHQGIDRGSMAHSPALSSEPPSALSSPSPPHPIPTSPNPPILIATAVRKTYRVGGQDLEVLRGVDVSVGEGEFLAVLGRSGSGKSTLLHLLGGLDRPDRGGGRVGGGEVRFRDTPLSRLGLGGINRYRNRRVGFVFQQYHLLPELSALENVLVSAMISRGVFAWMGGRRELRQRGVRLLEQVGLGERMRHRPNKLSGGERQRVAIARALINEPDVLLADEPTGNLDADTGRSILDLLQGLHAAGQTLVLVTHDPAVAAAADRRVTLVRGRIEKSQMRSSNNE